MSDASLLQVLAQSGIREDVLSTLRELEITTKSHIFGMMSGSTKMVARTLAIPVEEVEAVCASLRTALEAIPDDTVPVPAAAAAAAAAEEVRREPTPVEVRAAKLAYCREILNSVYGTREETEQIRQRVADMISPFDYSRCSVEGSSDPVEYLIPMWYASQYLYDGKPVAVHALPENVPGSFYSPDVCKKMLHQVLLQSAFQGEGVLPILALDVKNNIVLTPRTFNLTDTTADGRSHPFDLNQLEKLKLALKLVTTLEVCATAWEWFTEIRPSRMWR